MGQSLRSQGRKEKNFDEFMAAVERGNIATMKANFIPEFIEKRNQDGWTPLHVAAGYGRMESVTWLLDVGADVNAKDAIGQQPILMAARGGHIDVMNKLVECGADVHHLTEELSIGDTRLTPIHLLAVDGDESVMQWMVDNGIDMGCADRDGWTPLHSAVASGDVDALKWLLEHGFGNHGNDEDAVLEEHSLTDFAEWWGRNKVGNWLMQRAGADKLTLRLKPFAAALFSGQTDKVKLLLDSACPNAVDDPLMMGGVTPLWWAAYKGHVEMMQLLLERGANVEKETIYEQRPLHVACQEGHTDAVRLLVSTAGCVLNTKDENGNRPVDLATENGHDECVCLVQEEQAQRKEDEFQIFHFPTFSIVNRKYKIYDLQNTVEKIKTEIPCLKRPIVLCHLTDPLRLLGPWQKALKMVGGGLQYAEYFVECSWQSKDWQWRMTELRDWDADVVPNESTLETELNLQITRQADFSKWKQYVTVSLNLRNEHSQPANDTVHMLVVDSTNGAEVKKTFVDFLRFVNCGELFKILDETKPTKYDVTDWLNKWITTQMQMLMFYDDNQEKVGNEQSIIASSQKNAVYKISVVQKTPKEITFIPTLSKSDWTKESVAELVSQEYILIRCITDDELAWVMPCSNCQSATDVENTLRPRVLDDNRKGRLILVGANGELTANEKLNSVIHYAVALPYEDVEKMESIGRGSYGEVSKCRIGDEKTIYAIKKMEIDKNDGPDEMKNIITEVMVACRVGHHPNIVKYRRFFEDNSAFFIVIDCMQKSLYDYLKKKYPLKEAELISFANQILQGLKHLHDQKVIHRDIKCKNVLIDENGCVKLCDFGISKCQNVDTSKASKEGGKTVIGTERNMAPELIQPDRAAQYGQKSDIWQFGMMMVELITGKPPYPKLSDIQALLQIEREKKVEFELPSSYSRNLKEFVDSCLVYDPDGRPTCAKLLQNVIFVKNLVKQTDHRN